MDPKFQTSFIPKKPIIAEQRVSKRGGTTSIFMFVCMVIFLVSLTGAGFSVFLKSTLKKSQENYIVQLKSKESEYRLETIEKLSKASTKINLTNNLLKSHIAVSEIFSIISALTIENVRFSSFEFSAPTTGEEGIKISMKGMGNSFGAIAFQSDVFGESKEYGTQKVIKNPVLSDLTLESNGNVGFTFSALLVPSDIIYEKVLNEELGINEETP